MKKTIILALAACLLFQFSYAQTETGRFLVGGDIQFSSSKQTEDDTKETRFAFNPNVGYFFMDNLAGGIRLGIETATSKYDFFGETTKFTTTSLSALPFVRYYFLEVGDNVKFFGDGSFGFGSVKFKEEGESSETENFSQFGLSAGPAIFLTDNTALEIKGFFNSTKFKDQDGRVNSFGIGIGLQIHL